MNVALVHDYLGEFGGAERVLLALSELFPRAPIYTAFYREGSPAWERFYGKEVRVSWAHHIPGFATKLHSPLRFLAPLIWNSFDFSSYDVVISSASWYVTKGFGRKGKAIEVCYCHTPPRWLYGYTTSVELQRYAPVRWYAAVVGFFMRQYDYAAAQNVDAFIANSQETRRRIFKFYRRNATVIYPPIDLPPTRKMRNPARRTYYLVVSRLAQPKHIDVAIAAANRTGANLKIVGTGPDADRLQALAGPTVELVGYKSDAEIHKLYAGAIAFIATETDADFGMTPVEAQACGTPVIAFRGAGYLESVIEGKTGVFFDALTVEHLVAAMEQVRGISFSASACIANAQRFGTARFKQEITRFLKSQTSAKPSRRV